MNDSTKRMYKMGKGTYTVKLSFPELNLEYNTEVFEKDKFTLTEALMNGDSLEFVGCISNCLQVQIHNANANLEGKKVIASIDIKGQNDPMQLFVGYVKSSKTRSDLAYKELVCYDSLWKKVHDVDVSPWYKTISFPMTMKTLRDSFFEYVGIEQVVKTLPNDEIILSREYIPERMNALDVLKSICQFNAVCGIMNRQDKFDYISPESISDPSPEENFFYKSMQFEEYITNKIDRVEVRDDEDAETFSYGMGTNKYIIQGNMFVFGLSKASKRLVCENIYNTIKDFQYRPVSYQAVGLPFAEVGSCQQFKVLDWLNGDGEKVIRKFPLLSRTLEGIQELTDRVDIQGKRNQTEFISDVNAQIEAIRRTTQEIKNIAQRQIDYILPNDIDEAPIEDGENNDVVTFEFSNITEGEKTSMYSCLNFETETSIAGGVYGDCDVTAKIIVDGEEVEKVECNYGDGGQCLMLNYLLRDILKGNHSLVINISTSGGRINGFNIVSSYLLATASVDSGYPSEDYEAFDDDGNWGDDVLPDGLVPEVMTEDALDNGTMRSMIKKDLAPTPTSNDYNIQNLSQWFNSKYILMVGQYYAEEFYKTNGYYRKKGAKGEDTSITGKPIGNTAVYFYIPIKRIKGYHFFKYKAKLIQHNGKHKGDTTDYNVVRAGVAAVVDGKMVSRFIDFSYNTEWQEFSVGISTLPYVDYIVLTGTDGSPAYKDMRFVR